MQDPREQGRRPRVVAGESGREYSNAKVPDGELGTADRLGGEEGSDTTPTLPVYEGDEGKIHLGFRLLLFYEWYW